MKQIRGTVVVTFYADITEKVIETYLDKEGLEGIKVSQLRNRYAIDVPVGKEELYIQKFSANMEIVERTNPYFPIQK